MYKKILILLIVIIAISCKKEPKNIEIEQPISANLLKSQDVLNYVGTPKTIKDKKILMYSDQGAWFAYSFPDSINGYGGFSGPFLMTQQNGIWSSPALSQLAIKQNGIEKTLIPTKQISYNSHLEQEYTQKDFKIDQELTFLSGHTALIKTKITNTSKNKITLETHWRGSIFTEDIFLRKNGNELEIISEKSNAIGHIKFEEKDAILLKENKYTTKEQKIILQPQESLEKEISQTFIFPEYSWELEKQKINQTIFEELIEKRKQEKEAQIVALLNQKRIEFDEEKYKQLLAKTIITLQNNWRIPAGEIKHEGMFPSYHYKWFHGFWSWDTWKQAVGVAKYDPDLAKKQIRLMFEFQKEDGFIVDVVYRDTTIEKHNYRDTKPPLSAWAVHKIYKADSKKEFVAEMYPKLKKYHYWWYAKRDHDQDGLCEYGSTDGSLIAAKWESGMDNAIRFDDSKIVKNQEGAYSINQESVDLNAYLYAEKQFLAKLATILHKEEEAKSYINEANILKEKIQEQFYDTVDGWFYDTTLDGKKFIKGEGSEGWTALWAKAATQDQANAVVEKMLDTTKFYTKVPFQTMSADHPKFNPLKGYWRGPNWLDQAYFGVKALRNYGFDKEATQATKDILKGGKGILGKGEAIRENYHPITGEGLNAQNFSWSAAHIIMLLLEE